MRHFAGRMRDTVSISCPTSCCVTRALGGVSTQKLIQFLALLVRFAALDTHLPAAPYLDHSLPAYAARKCKIQQVQKIHHGRSIQPRYPCGY